MKINIVYRDMPCESVPAGESAGVTITWSRVPLAGSDVFFYMSAYSRPTGFSAPGLHFLYLSEPLCVYPDHYRKRVWQRFDAVYTWNPTLTHPAFRVIRRPFCGHPHPVAWNEEKPSEHQPAWEDRRHALCMINNNKRSLIEGELYSERVRVARWFHDDGQIPCDVFGKIPFGIPNYRGSISGSKLTTLREYRFALCFENLYLQPWSAGYVSEKLFDCLAAETLPIYWGATDIDQYLPMDCIIDYRKFKSLEALREYLMNMPESEWNRKRDAIRSFWKTEQPLHKWHWNRVYEDIVATAERIRHDPKAWENARREPYPLDYPATAGSKGYLARFYLSCFLVRHPKLVTRSLRVMAGLSRFSCRSRQMR